MAKDANGLTALDIAEKSQHLHSMEILKKAAGNISYVLLLKSSAYNSIILYGMDTEEEEKHLIDQHITCFSHYS